MTPTVKIILGDCLTELAKLPAESVHCCVTSPPYWGLRNYGVDGQIGLEKTPEEFVTKMVAVFREVRRVLREDGVLWLNLGDSYGGGKQGGGSVFSNGRNDGTKKGLGLERTLEARKCLKERADTGLKPKDLVGVPWRVAFALQADGWYLRSDIIWHKPNPMPESVTDRPTKAHEYLFLLAKNDRYFYDAEAIKEPADEQTQRRTPAPNVTEAVGNTGGNKRTDFEKNGRYTTTSRNTRPALSAVSVAGQTQRNVSPPIAPLGNSVLSSPFLRQCVVSSICRRRDLPAKDCVSNEQLCLLQCQL